MISGGPRNARQMQMMMRRLGMKTEEIGDVEEVIIRTRKEEHVIASPEVTIVTVQGVRTYQVIGNASVRPRGAGPTASASAAPAEPAAPAGPPDEDVELVMSQANVDREEAVAALKASDGAPAEAILHLLSRRGGGA